LEDDYDEWTKNMHNQEHDFTLEGLGDQALRERLRRRHGDPLAVSDEQLFTLFRLARQAANKRRVELFSAELSRRISGRARHFALKSKLVPHPYGELRDAEYEISAYVWDRVLDPKGKDAEYAEVAFGQLFKRRAIDFVRSLKLNQRGQEVKVDEHENIEEEFDALPAEDAHEALQDHETPDVVAARNQVFERVQDKMRAILTPEEYYTFVLLNVADWQVQEIAEALNVSLKTVNNYKNRALAKIEKEFKQ
jgi:RNA polymerase sigma factor (sigma-70 family)